MKALRKQRNIPWLQVRAVYCGLNIGTYWSLLTAGCNIMAGLCPLITTHLTSNFRWQYAMLLPGLLAITCSPLIYMMIYNTQKEAGLNGDNTMDSPTAKGKPVQYSWSKVLFQLLHSPFLWVLLHGDFLTAILKNGIGDWILLYLIQDKGQSQSTAGYIAVTFFEIGGILGSFLAVVVTVKWMHKLFIGVLLFGCDMALSGSISLYGLLAMENGPPGFSGTTHAIVALGSSFGAVMDGYPLATYGKLYGWDQTFSLFQIMAAVNFVVHFYTRNINKNMMDLNKIE